MESETTQTFTYADDLLPAAIPIEVCIIPAMPISSLKEKIIPKGFSAGLLQRQTTIYFIQRTIT